MSKKIPISELIVRADVVITNSLSLPVCDQRGEYLKKNCRIKYGERAKKKEEYRRKEK